MARTLSSTMKAALLAENTEEAIVVLLKITHASLAAPLYLCSNRVDVVSRSDTYLATGFDVTFPSESDDRPPHARLSIVNIDRQIVEAARTVAASGVKLDVRFEVVTLTDPDTVELGPYNFQLSDVRHNKQVVSGTLGFENILTQRATKGRFNPSGFPNIFT